jgi:outer membrane receptor protein involved in Fe transport
VIPASLALLLALPVASWAQRSTATINGTVRDATGAVIPQATISLTNTATNVTQTAVTNDAGTYMIIEIRPGTYVLKVQKEGFESVTQPAFTLEVNQTTAFDFTLPVGSTKQTVEVKAVAANIETSTAELGSVVTKTMVNDLPLNGRNFTELLELTPGVSPINVGQAGGYSLANFGAYTFPSVDGQTNRSNLFLMDGINNQGSFTSTYAIAPQIDDIEEFKVQSHNDEAQFGGALGGIVNLVTKGGTNAFHGDAFDFLRNRVLDGRPFFLPPAQPKQAYEQNQFGGTIAGPVVIPHLYDGRNRTFFYASYEGFRDHVAQSSLYRVPTQAELGGDLSDFRDTNGNMIQIYNPFSTRPDPDHPGYSLLDPFPNNQIPPNLISQNMVAYAALFPQPVDTGLAAFNGLDTEPSITRQETASLRFDEHLSDRDSLFARYTGTTQPDHSSGGFAGYESDAYIHGYNAAVNYTHTFSGNSVMDLVLGRNTMQYNTPAQFTRVPANFFQSVGFSSGFAGGFIGGMSQVPNFSIPGFASGGTDVSNFNSSNVWEFRGDFSKLRGRHTFKMGADFASNNAEALFESAGVGFSTAETSCSFCYAQSQGAPVGGVGFASFLLNVPDSAARRNVHETEHGGWIDGFYFQDQWKATDKLTVNLGLRYDFTLIPIYGNDKEDTDTTGDVNFNDGTYVLQKMPPACGNGVIAPCIPGGTLPDHVVISPHKNHRIFSNYMDNWQPRVGIAYRWKPTLVMHGSYGRFYDNWAAVVQTAQNTEGSWPQLGQLNVNNLNHNEVPSVSALNPFVDASGLGIPAPTPFASSGFAMWYMNPNQKNPYSDQWTLGFEKQVDANTTMTANYVGSTGRRLDVGGYYNVATTPGPGDPSTRAPYPYIPPTFYDRDTGRSSYNAFQFSLNHKTTKGFSYIFSYTWSKTMSEGCDGWYGVEGCSTEDPYNLNLDRSIASFDLTHMLSYSFAYEVPIGKGRRWSTGSRPLDYVLGNWQLNGIVYLSTGQPFYVGTYDDLANTGNVNERASRLAGVSPFANKGGAAPDGGLYWLNTNAFAWPAAYTFGTEGRNDLRMDWTRNFDLSLFRSFPFGESKRLEFRAEAFNAFNTPRFGEPDAYIDDYTFGEVYSTSNNPRQIQLALKFYF